MQNVCVIKMIRKWEAALYEWYSNVIINSWTFEIIHKVLNLLFEKVELMKCWWFRKDKSDCFLVWNHFWHTWVDTSRPHCRVFSHLATGTRHVNSEQAALSEAETYSPQSINHLYYTHLTHGLKMFSLSHSLHLWENHLWCCLRFFAWSSYMIIWQEYLITVQVLCICLTNQLTYIIFLTSLILSP